MDSEPRNDADGQRVNRVLAVVLAVVVFFGVRFAFYTLWN